MAESNVRYVITITRQFGSLGRPIAKKLAERLGIDYFDRELVDQAAKALNMKASVIGELEESARPKFFSMKYPLGTGTTEMQNQIFETQRMLIMKIASRESCIIVGRCADYILREYSNAIHIYIYAPDEIRKEVCIHDFHYSPEGAQQMMEEVDRAREHYHKQFAGYLPDDPRHKHLCVDSSVLGVDGTVDLLEHYVREFLSHRLDHNLVKDGEADG